MSREGFVSHCMQGLNFKKIKEALSPLILLLSLLIDKINGCGQIGFVSCKNLS